MRNEYKFLRLKEGESWLFPAEKLDEVRRAAFACRHGTPGFDCRIEPAGDGSLKLTRIKDGRVRPNQKPRQKTGRKEKYGIGKIEVGEFLLLDRTHLANARAAVAYARKSTEKKFTTKKMDICECLLITRTK